MVVQIFLGSFLMLITVFIHAIGMSLGLRWVISKHGDIERTSSMAQRSLIVGALVLVMFVATLLEAGVWAFTYYELHALPEFEEALYFSTVTYTTLGYGDVILPKEWRLLSSLQAANGVIMFGWTTAVIIAGIKGVSRKAQELRKLN